MALEEEHLGALLRNASDTGTVFDIEGNVTFVGGNPGGTLGRDDDEHLGRSAFSYIHPDDRLAIAAQLAEMVITPGAERVAECRLMHAGGSWVTARAWRSTCCTREGRAGRAPARARSRQAQGYLLGRPVPVDELDIA